MKVFIIGGCNTVVNALLQKFKKEGLKLYVLPAPINITTNINTYMSSIIFLMRTTVLRKCLKVYARM